MLGMPIISRISDPVHMTFFTLGVNHHDFAIMEVGEHAPAPDPHATGLAHVAFKIGDSLDEFRSVKTELDAAGIAILYEADRTTKRYVRSRPERDRGRASLPRTHGRPTSRLSPSTQPVEFDKRKHPSGIPGARNTQHWITG
jgi:hypothetical protein